MALVHYFSIDKLNRRNFARWEKDMKYLLMEKKCYDLVIEKESRPEQKLTDLEPSAAILDWNARERTAMSLIYLNVETELKSIIENCENAVAAWKKIRNHFRPDNRSYQISIFSELMSCNKKIG